MADEAEIELAGGRAISVGDPATAKVVVVLLHGFQMTPRDLSPFATALAPHVPAWFLFPEAPHAADMGRAWWHIDPALRLAALAKGPRDFAPQHPPDLPSARARLLAIVAAVRAKLDGRPFVLGGFSQGGMLSCDTVLRSTFPLDLLVLMSASRIAWSDWPPLLATDRMRDLPTLVSHGERDADLSFAAGTALRDCLVEAGARVDWVPFPEGHEIPLIVWRRLRKQLLALC